MCVLQERESEFIFHVCHMFTVPGFFLTYRTAVNSQTGVCTPAGGIVTSESRLFANASSVFQLAELSHVNGYII